MADGGAARCALIVVNYGSHRLLASNFDAAPGGDDVDVQVVVVDNPTPGGAREGIRTLCAERGWRLLENARNEGFGAAVNRAIRAVWDDGVSTFAVVNPDCVLPARARRARRHQPVPPPALVSPSLGDATGTTVFSGARVSMRTGEIRGAGSSRPFAAGAGDAREWLPGTCLVTSRELLATVGGFDERYFLYWEDVDLSIRCVDAGAELVVRDDLVVRHDAGATQGTQPGRAKSPLYYRYNCRNRLLFGARHAGPGERLSWVLRTPRVSREILLRGGRRQLRHRRPWTATLRGTVEGLAIFLRAAVTGASGARIPRFGDAARTPGQDTAAR